MIRSRPLIGRPPGGQINYTRTGRQISYARAGGQLTPLKLQTTGLLVVTSGRLAALGSSGVDLRVGDSLGWREDVGQERL